MPGNLTMPLDGVVRLRFAPAKGPAGAKREQAEDQI